MHTILSVKIQQRMRELQIERDTASGQANQLLTYPATWDDKFFHLAQHISQWSKHPKHKVGCVIVDSRHTVLSLGYNGLPRGIDDTRILDQTKPARVGSATVHAEANAVVNANASIKNSTVYITRAPCTQCAALLIQAGVATVAYDDTIAIPDDWMENCVNALTLLREAKVTVCRTKA